MKNLIIRDIKQFDMLRKNAIHSEDAEMVRITCIGTNQKIKTTGRIINVTELRDRMYGKD